MIDGNGQRYNQRWRQSGGCGYSGHNRGGDGEDVLAVGVMLGGRACKMVVEGHGGHGDDGDENDGGGHEDSSAGVTVVMVMVIEDGCYSPKAIKC